MAETQTMYHSLEELIKDRYGEQVSIAKSDRVSGGDINQEYSVELSLGEKLFVKANSMDRVNFFLTEQTGLEALRSTGKIGVPKILGLGTDHRRGISFLAMEYIGGALRSSSYWEIFGQELAGMHRTECQPFSGFEGAGCSYGFLEDNYIGASPQKNSPKEKWVDFYRECRLIPQLTMAERYLDSAVRKKAVRLLDHLEDYMREPEFPSLLHGDLWSGNVICGKDGKAWLIDPAAYVGDYETDLAMLQLFGNPPERFWRAYCESNPMDRRGYAERRALYQLYHLLNHLNLFGKAYLGSVVEIIARF